jgi:hypothetical protein
MYSTGDRKTPDLSRQVKATILVGSERFLERMLGVLSGNGREQRRQELENWRKHVLSGTRFFRINLCNVFIPASQYERITI